jgi:hypothetical protein
MDDVTPPPEPVAGRQDMGASATPTGLAGAEAPEPHSRLGPADGIPSAEPCPFCGGGFAPYENYPWGDAWLRHDSETCAVAGLRMKASHKSVAAWNRRIEQGARGLVLDDYWDARNSPQLDRIMSLLTWRPFIVMVLAAAFLVGAGL